LKGFILFIQVIVFLVNLMTVHSTINGSVYDKKKMCYIIVRLVISPAVYIKSGYTDVWL
jgi:hypothetical protein